jgi:hypothetical protein
MAKHHVLHGRCRQRQPRIVGRYYWVDCADRPRKLFVMSIEAALVSAVGSHRGGAAADRLCEACVELLAVDAASISLVLSGQNAGTLGASSAHARDYDELQFTLGEGPGLDSVSVRAPVLALDLAADVDVGRWPAYGPALLGKGVGAVFALPVVLAGEHAGALGLFRFRPAVLDGEELSGALVAAELAALPLLDLMGEDLEKAAGDPKTLAWTELNKITRSEVSQATGMLIGQLDIGPSEALVRLRAHAYLTGRSATEVARDILDRRLRLEPH